MNKKNLNCKNIGNSHKSFGKKINGSIDNLQSKCIDEIHVIRISHEICICLIFCHVRTLRSDSKWHLFLRAIARHDDIISTDRPTHHSTSWTPNYSTEYYRRLRIIISNYAMWTAGSRNTPFFRPIRWKLVP